MADAKNGNDKKRGKGGRLSPAMDKGVPLFLQKTYAMINSCDPAIAAWSEDGNSFVVKNQGTFEREIIPQYFDHNKFSSFARQLNFYGFRKMQQRAIRNDDYDKETSKHVTFLNENFKRGREDLLCRIQRSTKGGASAANQEQQQEIRNLKDKVEMLEGQVYTLHNRMMEMEENHQRQWEAFIQQFQYPHHDNMNQPPQNQVGNDGMNSLPSYPERAPSDRNGERKPDYSNNSNMPYTNAASTHGERNPDYTNNSSTSYTNGQQVPRREKSKVTISDEVEEMKPRQPTLKPHPNSKTLPDNVFLPPPPGGSEPALRGPSRGISFLRGFSKDYADMGLFDSERADEQVNIPPPSNGEINEMQQPDLSSFQQRYFQSMMSETEIVTSSTPSNQPSNTAGTDVPPPETSNHYGESIAKHAAKNMETLQNLNLNCKGIDEPEMKRLPSAIEPLPPM